MNCGRGPGSPVPFSYAKKLLLADDDVNATAAVAAFFEAHNFEVRTAADGITALGWFSTWQPDAAMLDIDMPGATGYEVARHVRRTESSDKRTLLVAITGEVPPHEIAAQCYSAGFDLHVAKPADVKALAEFVILGITG
ncbi:response regulator [Burkholderia sp. R-69980]|nr:response regulator [Burkholderia sp. R-69980]